MLFLITETNNTVQEFSILLHHQNLLTSKMHLYDSFFDFSFDSVFFFFCLGYR